MSRRVNFINNIVIYREIGDFLRCEPSARNTLTVRSAVREGRSGEDIAVSWYGIAGW